MTKYNPVRLVFNDSYGSVRWSKDFENSDELHKLDVLKDWCSILQDEYLVLLRKYNGRKRKQTSRKTS